jgi:hypothetical protein
VTTSPAGSDSSGGDSLEQLQDRTSDRDRDGIGSLRDVQEEAGDESEVEDLFELDVVEARERGVNLDAVDEDESRLS